MDTTYALLSIGVNRVPNATTLKFAERDALRFGLGVTSANGAIPPSNAKYLLGNITASELEKGLKQLARLRPTYLMLYFGGHGSASGIALADGIYPYVRLRKHLAAIDAHATIVVLNCCEAAGMFKSGTVVGGLGGLEPVSTAWGTRLLSTESGVRVFAAADSNKNTFESAIGGWFVTALLNAMFDTRPGDLVDEYGTELVSDLLVFQRARAIMRSMGVDPVADGVFGDFPMMLANGAPSGVVALKISSKPDLAIQVGATAQGRRHLPTTIVATPTDPFGNVLQPEHVVFLPTSDEATHRSRFQVDLGVSPGCTQQFWQYGACRVAWNVAALDSHGRVVGRARQLVDYTTGRFAPSMR
ncbi:MAG: caspase family protein [Myxococcota bacterium]|nr:caspase family protein [Myxococcota bacterium]